MEKKKNSKNYIIPPSFFEIKGAVVIADKSSGSKEEPVVKTETNTTPEEKTIATPVIEAPEKPSLLSERKERASGLSLNSIRLMRAHQKSKVTEVIDPNNLPKQPFTEAKLLEVWQEYGKRMDRKGERILGSMFAMNIPSLQDSNVFLELPNESMKVDLETAKAPLLQHLHQALNNYGIELIIHVNESVAKKHAFTPQDKYEKLKEKNPLIEKLRAIFDLDI